MQLKLDQSKVEHFENSMAALVPWMHPYKFSDKILTGLFRYEGLPNELNFCNSKSDPEDIRRMNQAYNSRRHNLFWEYFEKILNQLDIADRSACTLLDLASATGKNSILAVNQGFGKVIASEIRKSQCDQQELLYQCLEDPKYRERITVRNDTVSADRAEFVDLYRGKNIDVVLSFGLMYHLVNPVQHIANLYEIATRYAVIYTQTHLAPYREFLWKLKIEDKKWVTKATESISWNAHFIEIVRICKLVGFKSVKIVYPDVFEKYFKPDPEHYDPKVIWLQEKLARFGIKIGVRKICDFKYFQYMGLNPEYITFVCEK